MSDARAPGPESAPTPSGPSTPDESRRPRLEFESGDETEMNMTPMIDIVFQLIIFFLLSLKFKTVDERIDARLPKEVGPDSRLAPPIETPKIKVKLYRKHKGQPHAYTLLKIDNSHQLRFPNGRVAGDGDYAAVRARLRGILAAKWETLGHAADVRAEIVAPRPDGGAVPHGDAVQVLDTFLEVGLVNVVFEGAPMPLPTR